MYNSENPLLSTSSVAITFLKKRKALIDNLQNTDPKSIKHVGNDFVQILLYGSSSVKSILSNTIDYTNILTICLVFS